MAYEELEKIAKPHIRNGAELPSNSFLLLTQLQIPIKDKKQCEEDYNGKMNPLYNTPAFLKIDGTKKTIYFNADTQYWNFYIFHEISHYLLGHTHSTPQNEIDADMLSCILSAPIENLPTSIKSARDLSVICKIPIDKAEQYWNIIKHKIKKDKKSILTKAIAISLVIMCCCFMYEVSPLKNKYNTNNIKQEENIPNVKAYDNSINDTVPKENVVYITKTGKKYHLSNCRYIQGKNNLTELTIFEAENAGYEPCKVCKP